MSTNQSPKPARHTVTYDEAARIVDGYFASLDAKITAFTKEAFPPQALKLFTADGTMLEFGKDDDIQEATEITEGTPVKLADGGKVEDGDYVMPDGTTYKIAEGVVKKIIKPTTEQLAAMIRKDMKDFKAELRNIIVRKPFKRTGYLK